MPSRTEPRKDLLRAWGATLTLLMASALPAQMAAIRVGSIEARAGEMDLGVPLFLTVDGEDQGGEPIAGLWITVGYDPDVLGSVRLESARKSLYAAPRDPDLFVEPGRVGIHIIYSTLLEEREEQLILPGESVEVARIRACILPSALPGQHSLVLVDGHPDAGGDPFVRTRARTPSDVEHRVRRVAGAVTVIPDGEAPSGCLPDPHSDPYPEVPRGTLRLGWTWAARGEEAVLPFFLQVDTETTGFALSIDFDEEDLILSSFEEIEFRPGGGGYEFIGLHINNENEVPGNSGIEEGFFSVVAILPTAGDEPVFLARDVEHEALRLRFRIRSESSAASSTIRFLDGARRPGAPPVRNTIIAYTAPGYVPAQVVVSPGFVLIDGQLRIVGDVTVFLRGDANDDGLRDISDPLAIASFLFLGGEPHACRDAADVNDDGAIDIADPIACLEFLFLGVKPMPAPFLLAGPDFTEDGLDCRLDRQ